MKEKKNSSMGIALTLLKNEADAMISAGNTGALHAGSSLIVRKMKGVRRSALATILPLEKPLLLMDCGANPVVTADVLCKTMKTYPNLERLTASDVTVSMKDYVEICRLNEKADVSVLDLLVERSNLFHYKNKHYYLFAKSGFTKGCVEKATAMGNVTLVEYETMM